MKTNRCARPDRSQRRSDGRATLLGDHPRRIGVLGGGRCACASSPVLKRRGRSETKRHAQQDRRWSRETHDSCALGVSMSENGLIEAIREGLPPGVELDEREEALLDLAASQAHDIGLAEADIKARGYLVPASRGGQIVIPSLAGARQGRIALGKLFGQLDLPESTRVPSGAPGAGLMPAGGRSRSPAREDDPLPELRLGAGVPFPENGSHPPRTHPCGRPPPRLRARRPRLRRRARRHRREERQQRHRRVGSRDRLPSRRR